MTTRVVTIIPAHNEERDISTAIQSVQQQTHKVDEIFVVADKCTDNTVQISEEQGAKVLTTRSNEGKKAGALNQALREVLVDLHDTDIVLCMDADSRISSRYIQEASKELETSTNGAVGGVFYGRKTKRFSLIESLQAVEYIRYARQIGRRKKDAYVLTGTATAFRVGVLREVARGRKDGTLPPGVGTFFDEHTMTEDSHMTFDVKTLGYKTPSPMDCWVLTEVMPTWGQLWKQRRRWQLGALENLKSFGWLTKVTWAYTARQFVGFLEMLFILGYIVTTVFSVTEGQFHIIPLWTFVGAIFWLERIVSARRAGRKAMLLAASMLPELGYGMFLKAVNAYSYWKLASNTQTPW